MADPQVQTSKPAEDDGIVSRGNPKLNPTSQPTSQPASGPSRDQEATTNVRKSMLKSAEPKADDKNLAAPVDPKITALSNELCQVPELLKDQNNLPKIKATIEKIKELDPNSRSAFTTDFKKKTGQAPLDYFTANVLGNDPSRREKYREAFEGKKINADDLDSALVGGSKPPAAAPSNPQNGNPPTTQVSPDQDSQNPANLSDRQKARRAGIETGTGVAHEAVDGAENIAIREVERFAGGAGVGHILRGMEKARGHIEKGREDGLRANGGVSTPQNQNQNQTGAPVAAPVPTLQRPGQRDPNDGVIGRTPNNSPIYSKAMLKHIHGEEQKPLTEKISQAEIKAKNEWEKFKSDNKVGVFNRGKFDKDKERIYGEVETLKLDLRMLKEKQDQEADQQKQLRKQQGIDERTDLEKAGDKVGRGIKRAVADEVRNRLPF